MNDRTLGLTRKTLGKSLRAPLLEENFTCRALQLAVVGLLGGVGVFLDQKRAWHLGKESGQLSAKLFCCCRSSCSSSSSLPLPFSKKKADR